MQISSKNAEIPYYIAYLYSEQQKWKDAEEYYRKSLAINPESEAKNLLPYIMQNLTLADYNDAVSLFEKNQYESAYSMLFLTSIFILFNVLNLLTNLFNLSLQLNTSV